LAVVLRHPFLVSAEGGCSVVTVFCLLSDVESGQIGVHFALRSPSEKARRNLWLARVDHVFDILADPAD